MPKSTTVDTVQINGWTPETMERAVLALAEIAAARSAETKDQEILLALELTRCLQCAVQEDCQELVEYLEVKRPSGPDASPWAHLEELLSGDQPLGDLVGSLKQQYNNPVPILRTLLDEAVDSDEQWGEIDRAYQRAVEVLVALGTQESLAYVVGHVNLLCWDSTDRGEHLRTLVAQHSVLFTEVVITVWPELDWGDRTTLMLSFDECKIPKPALIELVFATDGNTLEYDERYRFLEALVYSEDARANAAILRLIDHALDELSRVRSEAAMSFVNSAAYFLTTEMETDAPEQQKRAADLGLEISWLTGSRSPATE